MKTLKTISGREINVTTNYQKRTFTIRTSSAKFRTTTMSKEEFNSCLYKTGNDWQQFLKGNDYYTVN